MKILISVLFLSFMSSTLAMASGNWVECKELGTSSQPHQGWKVTVSADKSSAMLQDMATSSISVKACKKPNRPRVEYGSTERLTCTDPNAPDDGGRAVSIYESKEVPGYMTASIYDDTSFGPNLFMTQMPCEEN